MSQQAADDSGNGATVGHIRALIQMHIARYPKSTPDLQIVVDLLNDLTLGLAPSVVEAIFRDGEAHGYARAMREVEGRRRAGQRRRWHLTSVPVVSGVALIAWTVIRRVAKQFFVHPTVAAAVTVASVSTVAGGVIAFAPAPPVYTAGRTPGACSAVTPGTRGPRLLNDSAPTPPGARPAVPAPSRSASPSASSVPASVPASAAPTPTPTPAYPQWTPPSAPGQAPADPGNDQRWDHHRDHGGPNWGFPSNAPASPPASGNLNHWLKRVRESYCSFSVPE